MSKKLASELVKIAKELISSQWTDMPARPGTGDSPGWHAGFGPDGHVIEGYVGGLPITTRERGLIQKVSKKTKKELEKALQDPEIQEALQHAGIKNIHIAPTNKAWTMYNDNGALGIHPRTMEAIEKSPIPERQKGGIKRVIHHEAGHGLWNRATEEQKKKFVEVIRKHPEIKDMIGKIVSLKAVQEVFHHHSDRAEKECHAELHAMKKYAPEVYNKLPREVREAVEDIAKK